MPGADAKSDPNIAVIRGGRPLKGSVNISGSKHSALHILGGALLASGDVILDNFPDIEDARHILHIYESMGVECRANNGRAVLSVIPGRIRFAEGQLFRVRQLRSSVLLLGSLLLRTRHLRMPVPGGDRIDPDGRRNIAEFLAVLEMFGIPHEHDNDHLEAWIDGELNGDHDIDLGDKGRFGFPTGNNRTALAMILAAGHRGRTVLRSALRVAEICQLGEFLRSLGHGVEGLGTDVLAIQGKGVEADPGQDAVRVVLYPDKCEIVFWIVAACITLGDLVLRLPPQFGDYTVDDLGPLYRMREAIFSGMGIPLEKISGCEYRVAAAGRRFRGIDLILNHLETETNGQVMDACPYFIPLMCGAEGESRYLDGKYGHRRVQFASELNRLGARIDVDERGTAYIQGDKEWKTEPLWCEAQDIRGAGAIMLAMLATPGENRLVGVDFLRRANDYLPKLRQLGCDIRPVQTGGRDDLIAATSHRVRRITVLRDGRLGMDYEDRPPAVIEGSDLVSEALLLAFLHPSLRCTAGVGSLVLELTGKPPLYLAIDPVSQQGIKVSAGLPTGETTCRMLQRHTPAMEAPSGLEEYLGIGIGGRKYFAGRCLNPVPFAVWETRIASILRSPEQMQIPLTVTLGITDSCNLGCEYCFAAGRERGASLPGPVVLGLIDQLADAGVKAVRFVGGGEPTLHPDFVRVVLLARTRGLGTFLITNGTTLNLRAAVLAECLDSIRISVQPEGQAPCESMTQAPGAVFGEIMEGIRLLRRAAGSRNSGTNLLIGASCVVTEGNITSMLDWARSLKSAGADYVLFKKAHQLVLSGAQREAVRRNIRTIRDQLEDDSFKAVPELFEYRMPQLPADAPDVAPGCLLMQLRCVVEASGDVLTCNQKGQGFFGRLGNVRDQSFIGIMTGEERRRALQKRCEQGTVCRGCLFQDAHLLFREMMKPAGRSVCHGA